MFILVMILGLLPFAAGYGLRLAPKLLEGYLAYVTAAVFLIIWFFVAKLAKLMYKKTFGTTGYLNLPGFLVTIIVVIQILFTEGFWNNQFGTWSSMFFDAVKPLGILIADQLPQKYYVIFIYLSSFAILLIVSFFGCVFTKTKKRTSTSGDGSGLAKLAQEAEASKAELDSKN